MPQLSKTETDRKFRQANQMGAKESRQLDSSRTNDEDASSSWTKLGYEVFNKRRAPSVQVPLTLSDSSASSASYTGSALLDSFVHEHKTEPSSLDTLRLISIADSPLPEPIDSKATSDIATAQQDEPQEETKSEERDLVDDLVDQTHLVDAVSADNQSRADLIEKILVQESLLEEGLHSEATNIHAEAGLAEAKSVGIESTEAEFLEPVELEPIDSVSIEPEPIEPEPIKPNSVEVDFDATDSNTTDLVETESIESVALEQASESVEIQELVVEIPEAHQPADNQSVQQSEDVESDQLDHPPEEAPPDYLDGAPTASISGSSSSPEVSSNSQSALNSYKQSLPQKRSSAPITQSVPAFSGAHQEKRARDGAASVGLIDITDTLLFGGDRPDLVSADPFIPRGSDLNVPGVLAYLTNQISAFTVDRLQSGFPYNTDPKVLNRLDLPKYKTVLSIDDFRLGRLVSSEKEPKRSIEQQHTTHENGTDVRSLSQQVEELNRKIADLTQKLDQVTDS